MKVHLLVFTGTNWNDYRARIRAMALASNMLGILDGSVHDDTYDVLSTDDEVIRARSDYITKKNTLYSYLIGTQSPETLATVIDCAEGDARAVWVRLLQQYESTSKASLKHLIFQLVESRQGAKSTAEFVSTLMELRRRVEEIANRSPGISILDELTTMVMIQGLPRKFEAVKSQLLMYDHLSLSKCKRHILHASEIITLSESERSIGELALRAESRTCNFCNKPGHIESRCFTKYPELRKKNSTDPKSNGGEPVSGSKHWSSDSSSAQSVTKVEYRGW